MLHSDSSGDPPASGVSASTETVPTGPRIVVRHSIITRFTHWINAVAMILLLMSGLQIFNAHPALYWSEAGFDPDTAAFAIGDSGDEFNPRGWMQIGTHRFDTTGVLGISGPSDAPVDQAFPGWLTIPSWRDLSTGRRWHFFFAWVFVFNGLLYLGASIASGHLRRDLFPRMAELSARNIARSVWNHLRLRHPAGEAALRYNVLQKVSYIGVIFILVPMIALTGWAMSPGLNAAVSWLPELFGGRQAARLLHFVAANLLVLFIVVHLVALLSVGVWNELRAMITGRYVVPEER